MDELVKTVDGLIDLSVLPEKEALRLCDQTLAMMRYHTFREQEQAGREGRLIDELVRKERVQTLDYLRKYIARVCETAPAPNQDSLSQEDLEVIEQSLLDWDKDLRRQNIRSMGTRQATLDDALACVRRAKTS